MLNIHIFPAGKSQTIKKALDIRNLNWTLYHKKIAIFRYLDQMEMKVVENTAPRE